MKKTPLNRQLIFLSLSFFIGVILALLSYAGIDNKLTYLWIGSCTCLFLLAYKNQHSLHRPFIGSLIASFLGAMPFVWPNTSISSSVTWLCIINLYAINAFHIAYQSDGYHLKYETLFYAVWDTFSKLCIAGFFTTVCWLILLLWGSLFNLIGISFFQSLFNKSWFIIWSVSFFLGTGLFIADVTKNITRNLRHVLLLICRYLLPILAIIGLLFIASWIVKVILLKGKIQSNTFWFLSFASLSILFINGAYQNGRADNAYPKIILWIINLFIITAPLFSFIALYLLYTNDNQGIQHSGLNAITFNQLIIILLLLIYNLTYAVIILCQQNPWLKSLKKANILLAALVVFTTLTTNNFLFTHASFNPGAIQPSYNHQKIKIKNLITHNRIAMKKAKILWVKQNGSTTIKNALILGYAPHPIYLCRTKVNGHYYSGVAVDGQQCQYIREGTAKKTTAFEVLTGSLNQIRWQSFYWGSKNTFPIIVGKHQNNLIKVCRVIYKNRIAVGITQKSRCTIISKDQAITLPNQTLVEVLYGVINNGD